ncbi:MAG TPA: ribbon-helix-helix protein, CopG family [Nitrososphaeria archaeon]|nr:ribbon-helix-helix protein, CopG family [Nitrososphaeria archaeon]
MVTTVMTFSCDVEDALAIERYCRMKGYSKSWFIRECVMQVVEGRAPLMPRDLRPMMKAGSSD